MLFSELRGHQTCTWCTHTCSPSVLTHKIDLIFKRAVLGIGSRALCVPGKCSTLSYIHSPVASFILGLGLTVLPRLVLNFVQTSAHSLLSAGISELYHQVWLMGFTFMGFSVKFQYAYAMCNARIKVMNDIACPFSVLGTIWQF